MFIHEFTPDQQNAFLILAHIVMEADGMRSEQEALVMQHFKRELGLPPQYVPSGLIEVDAIAAFDTQRRRRIALLELSAIAVADELDETELVVLRRFADQFGLTALELDAMVAWSARQLLLVAEADLLLKRGG